MSKHYLVTGGCGFIGSNYIRQQLRLQPDLRITNLDALTYAGNPENLRDVEASAGDRYTFIHADLANAQAVADAFAGRSSDAVINFAAGLWKSVTVNSGTLNLFLSPRDLRA